MRKLHDPVSTFLCDACLSIMPSEIVLKSAALLASRKMTIAFAESATGGRLAAEYSLSPESGQILKGGLVCYDACIKQDILGVPKQLIEQYTPESAEVTRELAVRLQDFIRADITVGVTGLTTPGGSETPEKPVGTMFIHIVMNGRHISLREVFSGPAEAIVMLSVDSVARAIFNALE